MFYYYYKRTDPTWVDYQSRPDPIRVKLLHNPTRWTDPTRDQDSCPQSRRTPRGIKIHIHKVDGSREGSRFMSTKWTDLTRVKNLHKSTKWTDPTRDQNSYPQSGRTPQGIKIHVHKVDRPNKSKKLN